MVGHHTDPVAGNLGEGETGTGRNPPEEGVRHRVGFGQGKDSHADVGHKELD